MLDTFRHQGMRRKLVDEIRNKGIKNESVLEALNKVPRHLFMDSSFIEYAYKDSAFPIAAGQTISQPYTVAYQTELLDVQKGDKVLEVGTGSGYQACVLYTMGARVFTIERQEELYRQTKLFFTKMNYNIKTFFGDGYAGLPTYAPFNKIIVTAGAPFIPEKLITQLKVGGTLVIPVDSQDNSYQIMTTVVRLSETETIVKEWDTFRFVPMLQNKNFGK